MGLFDLLRPGRDESERTASALEAARANAPDDSAIGRLVQVFMDAGLDGRGPLRSATSIAEAARRRTSDPEEGVDRVVRLHVVGGAVGGFVTGLGGFVTMPVALPVNIAEFYIQATRMVGGIATLRGYDLADPQVRTAVMLTLVGARADEVLAKAGLSTSGGSMTRLALGRLPPAALMVVNKAVAFRLMRGVFERFFSRLGRGVPFVGGIIGAVIDSLDDAADRRASARGVPAGRDLGRHSVSKDDTPISDQIKRAVDDLELEAKVREAAVAAEEAVLRGLEATGSYLREHRGDIEGFFDRAFGAIDRQTGGRYADQVEQVRGQLVAGVASLADREWGPSVTAAPAEPAELPAPEPPDTPRDAESPDDGWDGSTDPV